MGRRTHGQKPIEWPPRSGITIRRTTNRKRIDGVLKEFGRAFIINVPARLASKRTRPQTTTLKAAKEIARGYFKQAQEIGRSAFVLKATELGDAARALRRLEEARIKMNLFQLVEFALPHLNPAGGLKTLGAVIDELQRNKALQLKRKTISKRTVDSFRLLSDALRDELGDKWINEVSKDDLYEWLSDIADENKPRTVRNHRMTAGEIFRHACQRRYVTTSPLFYLTRAELKVLEATAMDSREPKCLTVPEARRLVDFAYRNPKLKLTGVVVCALYAGVRTTEAQKLDWADVKIDGDAPTIKISPAIAKKRRIRNIALEPYAVKLLERIPNRVGLVGGDQATDGWYTKRFTKLCRLAGFAVKERGQWVSKWNNNAMRHSFGTYHYALYSDSSLTSALMGHKKGDGELFAHYRALAEKKDGEEYFDINGDHVWFSAPATTPEEREKQRLKDLGDDIDSIAKLAGLTIPTPSPARRARRRKKAGRAGGASRS